VHLKIVAFEELAHRVPPVFREVELDELRKLLDQPPLGLLAIFTLDRDLIEKSALLLGESHVVLLLAKSLDLTEGIGGHVLVGFELAEMILFVLVKLNEFFLGILDLSVSSFDSNDVFLALDHLLDYLRFFLRLLHEVWLLLQDSLEFFGACFESEDLADTVIGMSEISLAPS
jgi:hypothetical protein